MRKLRRYDKQPAQEQKGRRGKIRKDRIEALRIAIRSGAYQIPSDLVADCIIRETLGMFADSRLYSSDENLQSHKISTRERDQYIQIRPSTSSRNYRPTG